MSSYGKPQKHWRYIASKVDQNELEASRTIKNQRLEKFSPAKLNDFSHEHSFIKSPAKNPLRKETRLPSPRNNLLSPRQNLTVTGNPSEQVLTYVMKCGSIQKKSSNILDTLRMSNNSSQQGWTSLLQEMKKNYEQFRNEVMTQLREYQQYINQQMAKVFDVLKMLGSGIQESGKGEAEAKNDLQDCDIDMESVRNLKNIKTLKISKSADILTFIPEKKQAKTRVKQIQNKFNECMSSKIEFIETRQAASFDKFFQIMQKLRDTIDRSISPKKESNILKENNQNNV